VARGPADHPPRGRLSGGGKKPPTATIVRPGGERDGSSEPLRYANRRTAGSADRSRSWGDREFWLAWPPDWLLIGVIGLWLRRGQDSPGHENGEDARRRRGQPRFACREGSTPKPNSRAGGNSVQASKTGSGQEQREAVISSEAERGTRKHSTGWQCYRDGRWTPTLGPIAAVY